MSRIAVVTDSTADLTFAAAEDIGLRVVPMTVSFGDVSYISRLNLGTEEFYAKLADADELPTTSQPSPFWFEEAYADAADEGCDGIVSIHLSGELSGTIASAKAAAANSPIPVEIVDTGQVSGGLALIVLAANRVAAAGGSLTEVATAARNAAATTKVFFVVDTLDYLRKGGRMSGAQAMVGTVLRVKPILGLVDGQVQLIDRARTWSRALPALVDHVVKAAGDKPVEVFLTHALAPERAAEMKTALEAALTIKTYTEAHIGPVLGVHCGPGTIGVGVRTLA